MNLLFEGQVCPDGVELVEISHEQEKERLRKDFAGRDEAEARAWEKIFVPPRPEDFENRGGIFFQYRTEKRKPVSKEISNLESPLIVDFINATTDKKRQAFFSQWGLRSPDLSRDLHSDILREQERARMALCVAASGNSREALKMVEILSRSSSFELMLRLRGDSGTPKMLLKTETLVRVMDFECMMAAEHGARLSECERCKSVFLTGALTLRRSTARFCRATCRAEVWKKTRAKEGKDG